MICSFYKNDAKLKDRLKKTLGQFRVVQFLVWCSGTWPVVRYILKQASRQLMARKQSEAAVRHKGGGKDGKGVWTEILRALFGSYAH